MSHFQQSAENTNGRAAQSFTWLVLLGINVLALVGSYFFVTKEDYVGVIFVLAALLGGIGGLRFGAARFLASIIGLAIAVNLAPSLGVTCEHHFAEWLHTSGITNRLISIGVIGFGIVMVVTVFVSLLTDQVTNNFAGLQAVDSCAGLGLGVVEGSLAALMLAGGVLTMAPTSPTGDSNPGGHSLLKVHNLVGRCEKEILQSQLGPFIEEFNPFIKIPHLNQLANMQKTVLGLNRPGTIKRVMNHPRIRQMQQDPVVNEAMRRVMSDPTIAEYVRGRKPLDHSAAMTLLNHPDFLNLVDQPGFLEEANRIITEAGGSVHR